MCWSKYEREQWERERREAELEAERLRFISTAEPRAEEHGGRGRGARERARPQLARTLQIVAAARHSAGGRLTLQTRAPSNSATGTS